MDRESKVDLSYSLCTFSLLGFSQTINKQVPQFTGSSLLELGTARIWALISLLTSSPSWISILFLFSPNLRLEWSALPLSVVARAFLMKSIFLFEITYIFWQPPIWISLQLFRKTDDIITTFLWVGKAPRIALTTQLMMLPLPYQIYIYNTCHLICIGYTTPWKPHTGFEVDYNGFPTNPSIFSI